MGILETTSLAATVDAANDAAFFGRGIDKAEARAAAAWIAGRQGLPGSYAGAFAPTEKDRQTGLRLFTGERISTRAGVSHILGEEACRALLILGASGKAREALDAAVESLFARVYPGKADPGRYCCGKCSVALWRHLAVSDTPKAERHLAASVRYLTSVREGDGRWHALPFHYALSALLEMPETLARAELRYAAPAVERSVKAARGTDVFSRRRRAVAERALERA